MKELTSRQAQVLRLIQKTVKDSGFPPTRAEIAKALGFRSANAAEEHLRALAKKGRITLLPGTSRGIRIEDEERSEIKGLPVVGRVAAGQPVLAIENIEDHQMIDPMLFHPKADYLLRVVGTSMQDAGILDRDLLAVSRTKEITNGQIVVARLNEEVTVKRFYQDEYRVTLSPENIEFKPIEIDLRVEDFFIEGLGVGVFRTYPS